MKSHLLLAVGAISDVENGELYHQFAWEKSDSEVILCVMYLELKLNVISGYDK